MELYQHLLREESVPDSAVALGMFDGVHRGHQKVIRAAAELSHLRTVVLTFTTKRRRPKKKATQKDILTPENRLKCLEQTGVDAVYMPDFDEMKQITAEEFISDILQGVLNAKVVCCGEDFRFGYRAMGDVNFLTERCAQLGIKVIVVPPEQDGERTVSSTWIRQCLLEGDIPTANRLLGYRYFIEGEVVYGKQLGRTIDCPTINQELSENICIPRYGVYISTTTIQGKEYPSITNIGIKPTILGQRQPLAETHVIGINRHMYGEVLRVKLYKFIRREQRFDSIYELSRHIQRDIHTARLYFKDGIL